MRGGAATGFTGVGKACVIGSPAVAAAVGRPGFGVPSLGIFHPAGDDDLGGDLFVDGGDVVPPRSVQNRPAPGTPVVPPRSVRNRPAPGTPVVVAVAIVKDPDPGLPLALPDAGDPALGPARLAGGAPPPHHPGPPPCGARPRARGQKVAAGAC